MYSQSITRAHRTAFIIVIDGSGSMSEELVFAGCRMSKAEAVAEVANRLLFELVERARRSDGVRDYYDIAVVSYSGDGVQSVFSEDEGFISVCDLADMKTPTTSHTSEYRLPDGRVSLRKITLPYWIAPQAQGETPMYEALLCVRDMATKWVAQPDHVDSFPPIIFNITDGESSDCDSDELKEVCSQIKELKTKDGNALLMNIHIAVNQTGKSLLFPTEYEVDYTNRYARLLYDCSSLMPDVMNEAIRDLKSSISLPPFRGMSYNASVAELAAILNIGSISISIQ